MVEYAALEDNAANLMDATLVDIVAPLADKLI